MRTVVFLFLISSTAMAQATLVELQDLLRKHPSFAGVEIKSVQPADEVERGSFPATRSPKNGVGIPLVVHVQDAADSAMAKVNGRVFQRAVPITVTLEGTPRVHDPLHETFEVTLGGVKPLNRNIAAAVVSMVRKERDALKGLGGVLVPKQFQDRAGIYFPQPYREGTDVVVMTHGLLQSPYVWGEVTSRLLEDPKFTAKYSLAYGYFPTGQDPNKTAEQLTDDLVHDREILGFENAVLVGHSLGGMVTKAMVSRPELAEKLSFVKKAVFVSAPFGGTPVPYGGKVLSRFFLYPDALKALRPESEFMREVRNLTPKVESHVIAGVGTPRMAEFDPGIWGEDARGQGEAAFWDVLYRMNQGLFRSYHGLGPGKANDGMVSLESMTDLPGAESVSVFEASHGGVVTLPETAEIIRDVALGNPVMDSPDPKTNNSGWIFPINFGLWATRQVLDRSEGAWNHTGGPAIRGLNKGLDSLKDNFRLRWH